MLLVLIEIMVRCLSCAELRIDTGLRASRSVCFFLSCFHENMCLLSSSREPSFQSEIVDRVVTTLRFPPSLRSNSFCIKPVAFSSSYVDFVLVRGLFYAAFPQTFCLAAGLHLQEFLAPFSLQHLKVLSIRLAWSVFLQPRNMSRAAFQYWKTHSYTRLGYSVC